MLTWLSEPSSPHLNSQPEAKHYIHKLHKKNLALNNFISKPHCNFFFEALTQQPHLIPHSTTSPPNTNIKLPVSIFKMQISTPALLKLAVFLLASPGIVTAGVVPLSVNPLACTDLIWDEHDTGFQSRICTIPHPSITQDGAQALISRRVFEEVSEEFPSVFSTHTPITTETGMDSCAPFANTIAPSNEEQSDDTSESIPSKSTIQRRGACASRKQSLPYRTPLTSSEEAHSKSWCFRPGPSPNRNDITSLCRNIAQMAAPGSHGMPNNPFHDDFVVQRARGAAPGNATVENGGSCVCVAGRERTAGFKVCNCDR